MGGHEMGDASLRRRLANLAVCLPMGLCGCASTFIVQPDATLVRHYFGYVRVEIPQAAASRPVHISDVAALGVRIDGGFSIGASRDRDLVIPMDCRIVVLVANQAQLDDAIKKLSFFQDDPAFCAAVQPVN